MQSENGPRDQRTVQSPSAPRSGDRSLPIDGNELFAGRKEIVIAFNNTRYVLRITRHGKLILNK